MKTEIYVRAYADTMKALKFDDDGRNIQQNLFPSYFNTMHFPDAVAGITLRTPICY